MAKRMKTSDAVAHYGGIKQLSDALGIWPHNVSRWGEYVPASRAYEIEVKTGGKLKAGEQKNGRA